MSARARACLLAADCAARLGVEVSLLRSIESGVASPTPDLAARMEALIAALSREQLAHTSRGVAA